MIQSARTFPPEPPLLPSRFNRSNEPGAPFLPSGSEVGFPLPMQGQLLEPPFSFGCLTLTPIGATYCALCIRLARALAVDPMLTDLTPKSFVKTPLALPLTCTEMVSFGTRVFETVMSAAARPPPFLFAYCCASELAFAGSYGSVCAPARAAASAVDWVARSARYHVPMSRTRAAIPSRTVNQTTVRIVAWPLSLRVLIPHAPWSCSRGFRS